MLRGYFRHNDSTKKRFIKHSCAITIDQIKKVASILNKTDSSIIEKINDIRISCYRDENKVSVTFELKNRNYWHYDIGSNGITFNYNENKKTEKDFNIHILDL